MGARPRGGSQDEGKSFFAARTDGGELRIARLIEGGIHYAWVFATSTPKVLLSITEAWQSPLRFRDAEWRKCPGGTRTP